MLFSALKKLVTQRPHTQLIPAKDLALYHFGFCPYCRMVRGQIKILGLDIELRDIHQSEAFHKDLVEGGGSQTVPCLQITHQDGNIEWMYESADIVAYLDKRFR